MCVLGGEVLNHHHLVIFFFSLAFVLGAFLYTSFVAPPDRSLGFHSYSCYVSYILPASHTWYLGWDLSHPQNLRAAWTVNIVKANWRPGSSPTGPHMLILVYFFGDILCLKHSCCMECAKQIKSNWVIRGREDKKKEVKDEINPEEDKTDPKKAAFGYLSSKTRTVLRRQEETRLTLRGETEMDTLTSVSVFQRLSRDLSQTLCSWTGWTERRRWSDRQEQRSVFVGSQNDGH